MRIAIDRFKGVRPRVASDLLDGNEGQDADNCKITNGQLRAWDQDLSTQILQNTGTIITIYLYEDQYWFEWESDVDVVPGPVSGNTTGRFYYTGDGLPKKSDEDLATTGGGSLPIDYYPMGMPNPVPAPFATAGGGGAGDPRQVNYVWTAVSTWGEESVPSPASNIVLTLNGQTVNLTLMTMLWQSATQYSLHDSVYKTSDGEGGTYLYRCIQAGTSGATEPGNWSETVDGDTSDGGVIWRCFHNNITSKNIYRLATGNQYAQYQYLDSIDVAVTVYADSTDDEDLAGVLGSENYDPPPNNLAGLTYLSNGIILGFSGKDLYVSEAYRPWAWPIAYVKALKSPIRSIISIGSSALIATEGNPSIFTGTSPASVTERILPYSVACVAKRSSVGYRTSAIFAAPNGLAVASTEGLNMLTEKHYTVDEWKALSPTTMHGEVHDDKYFLFYSFGSTEGGLVLDLISGDLTELDWYASAVFEDENEERLYFNKHFQEVLLQEDGTPFPSRTNAILLEDGLSNLLLE